MCPVVHVARLPAWPLGVTITRCLGEEGLSRPLLFVCFVFWVGTATHDIYLLNEFKREPWGKNSVHVGICVKLFYHKNYCYGKREKSCFVSHPPFNCFGFGICFSLQTSCIWFFFCIIGFLRKSIKFPSILQ